MPKAISYVLQVCKDKVLFDSFDFVGKNIFSSPNYHYILIGNKIIDNSIMKKNANFILNNTKKQNYEDILNNQNIIIPKLLTHNKLIDIIKDEG
jgi:hypothetical protein